MGANYFFTSESVSEGHPDKIADQISDGVLDAILAHDPASRVACETFVKSGIVVIGGEITSQAYVDIPEVARKIIKEIGYVNGDMGFDYKTCGILTCIEQQSPDIAQGVNVGEGLYAEQGAGDQGMMFGYACDETPELMPATIMYAHRLLEKLAQDRKSQKVDWLRPDAKSQVTARYENDQMVGIDTIVLSTQHAAAVSHGQIKEYVIEECIKKVIPSNLLAKAKYLINPTGRFVIGGPQGDAGLTGRKIIVDTYGGHGAHGGGAFSGKDPSKVDRSAAYMARYVAKNIVAAKLAKKCLVQLAYAIGVADPVGIYVNPYGTGKFNHDQLADLIRQHFGFKPRQIIEHFNLLRPIYRRTATYGHFGRLEFPWEALDKVEALRG